jgi:hypothetical protein
LKNEKALFLVYMSEITQDTVNALAQIRDWLKLGVITPVDLMALSTAMYARDLLVNGGSAKNHRALKRMKRDKK